MICAEALYQTVVTLVLHFDGAQILQRFFGQAANDRPQLTLVKSREFVESDFEY